MELHHRILAISYRAIKLVKRIGQYLGLISSSELRVLLYHDIAPVDQQRFADQLRWLKRTWTFISPEKFAAILDGKEKLVGRNLLLTFDDGFASNRVVAEDVLKPLDIKALFFVITDFVDIEDAAEARLFISNYIYPDSQPNDLPIHWVNMHWEDLAALVEQGHSIGSHTRTHARLAKLSEQELRNEIIGSAEKISDKLGVSVEHFAYTFGDVASFSQHAMSVARTRYKYIYSGLRGDNANSISNYAIRRDASALQDKLNNYSVFANPLIGTLLEGAADRYYASHRKLLDSWAMSLPKIQEKRKARVIAFYLPQFHPIPENDLWWGKGFTEWSNVAKAIPLFEGHEQPRTPADLGFYDLRLAETRIAQAEMAARFGVEGFCYWHYWFDGRQLLERPFNEVLQSGQPDFPFCLGWANHSWSGIWKDEPHRVLIDQTYPGRADDQAHFDYLLKAFQDHRYIRVDDKPMLIVFKPTDIPNAKERFDFWRELAAKAGLKGLHIVGINMLDYKNPTELGLDAVTVSTLAVTNTTNAVVNEVTRITWGIRRKLALGGPRVIEYGEAIKHLVPDLNQFDCDAYPCVFPNWDNTPRKGRKGMVLANSTPQLFEEHLRNAVDAVAERDDQNRIVFLKSWNEWAEGNYLEPDTKWGLAYLEALKRVIGS